MLEKRWRIVFILLLFAIVSLEADRASAANRLCDLIDCDAMHERHAKEKEKLDAPIEIPDGYVTPGPTMRQIPALVNPWFANLERDSGRLDIGYCVLVDGYGWDGSLLWPVADGVIKPGRHFGETSNHRGIDIVAPPGTPVKASENGVVVWAGGNGFGWGNTVAVAHGGYVIIYAHLQDVYVECGQAVSTGTVIGTVGTSGNTDWPHVHLEVRYGDSMHEPTAVSIDPLRFVRGR